ncbi:DUF397 domain-containing protein [Nocardia aobensis]|uniref:DUF397 domain-containing protein n=1 Tax=Nocardia aobensis TaxID=257277 RepID=A0ABW6PCA2_9NOCA
MNADLSGANWFKSTYSGGGQDCIEVAFLAEGPVGVRDSKDRTGPALIFTPTEWDAFTSTVKANGFDQRA